MIVQSIQVHSSFPLSSYKYYESIRIIIQIHDVRVSILMLTNLIYPSFGAPPNAEWAEREDT
jgi:hypothetical protein